MKDLQIKQELNFVSIDDFQISYQVFGRDLYEAPVILIHHALTGNSQVAGESGWWKELVGEGKAVDLKKYSVLCFNIPGNTYDDQPPIPMTDYPTWSTKKVANLFWKALSELQIFHLHALIGGSLGGGIAWEMAFQNPDSVSNLIPIAVYYKVTDWIIGNVLIQEELLKTSDPPIELARMHAMTLYRTPESFSEKFKLEFSENENLYEVESWLFYHGRALAKRFSIPAYLAMNHLLRTIGEELTDEQLIDFAKKSSPKIHWIAIDSDRLFPLEEQLVQYEKLKKHKSNIELHILKSIHGHDAFLIEYQQLKEILNPILN